MPCYPALALLLGSAMTMEGRWIRSGTRVLTVVVGIAAIVCHGYLVVGAAMCRRQEIFLPL